MAHMGIGGLKGAVVPEHDKITVVAMPARVPDDAVAGGHDRRTRRHREVDAAMHLGVAKDRMVPHAEAGAQARAVDGCSQQRFAHAFAARIEEVRPGGPWRVAIEAKARSALRHRGVYDVEVAHSVAVLLVEPLAHLTRPADRM